MPPDSNDYSANVQSSFENYDTARRNIIEMRKQQARDNVDTLVYLWQRLAADRALPRNEQEFSHIEFAENEGGEWVFLNDQNPNDAQQNLNNIYDHLTINTNSDQVILDGLGKFNKKVLREIQRFAQDTEQDRQVMDDIKKNNIKPDESGGDSLNNNAVQRFLDGEEVELTTNFLQLRDGGTTNILSWKMAKEGRYGSDFRYIMRAMLGQMLMRTGSKDETVLVMGVLKKLWWTAENEGAEFYPGMSKSTIQADTQYCILQANDRQIYSAGVFKSQALLGVGYAHESVYKNADKTADSVKKVMFSPNFTKDKKFKRDKETGRWPEYKELNETGQGMLDMAVEWINSIKGGQGMPAIEGLDGKQFGKLINAIKIFIAVRDAHQNGATPEQYEAGLKMLHIRNEAEVAQISQQMGRMFNDYNNSNTRTQMTKGSNNGAILQFWLAKAGGRLHELKRPDLPDMKENTDSMISGDNEGTAEAFTEKDRREWLRNQTMQVQIADYAIRINQSEGEIGFASDADRSEFQNFYERHREEINVEIGKLAS